MKANGELAVENDGGAPPTKKSKAKTTVEEIYQKKSQLEHILLRPDTYIGSVEPVKESMWIFDTETEKMVQKDITYVPGLYKIFDEILVNAADNKQRDPKMDCIKIDIDAENNTVSVWNNGKGIPVVEHKDEKMYVPTMIFGYLLTSSNYNDEEEKVTGGRNGYGAKLCNIFSTKFTIETASIEYKRKFKQSWANNMTKTTDPKVVDFMGEDFTKVTFSPDLAKFKMTHLDKDIVDLMSRRAYDVAASTRGVKVILNGKRLPVKAFKDYVELYTKGKEDDAGNPVKIIYENVNERWEVAVAMSDNDFQQVSFVNSIATTKGGRHVDHVTDMLVKKLLEVCNKKNKAGMQLKASQIKNHLWVFINCLIVNPTFDSQTKTHMTLQMKSFGSKCTLSDKFVTAVTKCGIIEAVLSWAKFKAEAQMDKKCSGKKMTKLKGIAKLEDANDAGTKNSNNCTLILTEGDSAKSLAVSGLGVVGRDKYGVFPLRGKLLNVREATHKQILENAEINNLIKILGLQYKKKYENSDDLKTLRYGRLMIMTDQDQDGSHIKGLIINFIHHNWPSLLRIPFLEEFITPIVKATKGSEELSFYSLPEFEDWKKATDNAHLYRTKYYKGLGTSTSKEAKEYFQDMKRHRILFNYDGPSDDYCITMAFSKKCADQRKEWLTSWMEDCKRRREAGLGEAFLYHKNTTAVSYSDFINKELVLFSNLDNERSIPSMVDGLKPGQRKVLFTCLKRNDKKEIKVAQLAGSVAEHSAYHHGEVSLMGTIINLAQNYVGSNNINLLLPIGQFGTRLQGGKDSASPRYIFTQLNPLTRLIFHVHDDPLLKYNKDDNQKIEPEWYIPIIPMLLVNGADGIGTGWMTKIPNHNPREIVSNIKRMLDGDDPLPMKPWYKGFKGEIEAYGDARFMTSGEISILSDNQLEITELPVGTWTQAYKENVLEPLLHGVDNKVPPVIQDYKEYNTDTTVRFTVQMESNKLDKFEEEGLHKCFKLQSTINITSMCAFDPTGVLKRYDLVTSIFKEFFDLRMLFYQKRKSYLEGMLQSEADKLSNQARFIVEKCDGKLVIENKKKKVMIEELVKSGYDSDPVKAWKVNTDKETALEDDSSSDEESAQKAGPDFDYLLGMPMWSLTLERKNELLKKRDDKIQELKALQRKTPSDLWRDDLNAFLEKLDEIEQKEREEQAEGPKAVKDKKLKGKTGGGRLKILAAETMPSPVGRRVAPKVSEDDRKKVERLDQAARNTKDGIKKERKKKKETSSDVDELDKLTNQATKKGSLEERLGLSPEIIEKKISAKKTKGKVTDGLKQTKLNFKSKKDSPGQGKKKGKKRFSDSDESGSFDEDDVVRTPVARNVSRRAAATKLSFKGLDDDSEASSDNENEEFFDNDLNGVSNDAPKVVEDLDSENEDSFPTSKRKSRGSDSESDFEIEKKKTKSRPSSEDLFDSMMSGGGSSSAKPAEQSSSGDSTVKKPPPKKKKVTEKAEKPKKKAAPKKKKFFDSSDSENGSDSDFIC
ncbi:DNA topoisomerase 2 [Polyplax serrata]|uniref:DNA topoisomerase 2 n=1 Tax=Polyplax serrata TaxID=468196 RepID=A0AAN8SCK3_POLSC